MKLRIELSEEQINIIRADPEAQDWNMLCSNSFILSEEFMIEFFEFLNWANISQYQKLSEDFIAKFQNFVAWGNISYYQELSEDFIRKFQNRISWSSLVFYQNLSLYFLRDFKNRINWETYCRWNMYISKDIIIEFFDLIKLNCLLLNSNISDEFKNYIRMFI